MPVAAEIYYQIYSAREEGKTPPVVLIHGAGGTHLYWPAELRRLPGYRVFTLDLPGHGKSGGRGHQSIPGYRDSILTWMQAVGLHRAVFVGHSMGSAVALSLARDQPQHVLGLGLLGGGVRLRVAPALLEGLSNQSAYSQTLAAIVSAFFGPDAPPRLFELTAQRMAETRSTVLHGDFVACNSFNLAGRLKNIQQPALVLCGSEDRLTPVRVSQSLADSLPNARLEIIPGAGHLVMLEQPQAVAAALLDFLGKLPY